MKKISRLKTFAIIALFLLPVLMLSAWDQVSYFYVEVYRSNSRGEVHGPNKTSKIAEGKQVELSATNGSGEFICWIKDSSQVVSADSTYKFTMNQETQGSYLGLFTESSPTQMMYATLSGVMVNVEGITKMNVIVNIVPTTATTQVDTLYSGPATNQASNVYNGKVFSFLNEDLFIVNTTIQYEVAGIDYPLEHSFPSIYLSRADFTSEKITLTDNDLAPTLSLTFEKMNKELALKTFQN